MKKGIIVAMTFDRVIGKGNSLPWHIPEDFELFKKITSGNTVVMGRKTYNSIGHPLPGRDNIIVSSSMNAKEVSVMRGNKKLVVCKALEEALDCASKHKKVFFIGGAKIYEQALMISDEMYISWVKKNYVGDVYFPKVNFNEWECDSISNYEDFSQMHYRRKEK